MRQGYAQVQTSREKVVARAEFSAAGRIAHTRARTNRHIAAAPAGYIYNIQRPDEQILFISKKYREKERQNPTISATEQKCIYLFLRLCP